MIRKSLVLISSGMLLTTISSPELLAQPDPLNNKVLPHNAYVVSRFHSVITMPLSADISSRTTA